MAAAITAAVIGGGLGIAGAMMSADAQGDAADAAANSQRENNAQNYRMFLESRGKGGSAVMPLYMTNSDGSLFEASLGRDLVSGYNQSAPASIASFRRAGMPFADAQNRSTKMVGDIFNGGITDKLLTNAKPVQKARVTTARQSSLDALNKTLDSIDAVQAGKGFSGDSYAANKMRFDARKGVGDAMGAINLQNLSEDRQIRDYGDVQLPLENLSLPWTSARQAMEYANLPQTLYSNAVQQRLAPLSFLRIGGSQPFQYQPIPTAPPIASDGQLMAQGLSGMAGMVSNYAQQRQQEQMWQRLFSNGGSSYTGPSGTPTFMQNPGYQPSGWASFNSAAAPAPTSYFPTPTWDALSVPSA